MSDCQDMIMRIKRAQVIHAAPILLLMSCLSGCQPAGQDPVSPESTDGGITFESIGFETDSFELSSTKQSQLAVFETLFVNKDGYRIPGDPDPARLRAFFADLRESYFWKAEGIDYSLIRKQYHTFTHAMDVMITTHALLRSGGGVYLSSGEQAVLVLAALGHDSMHTGANNTFLINSKHPYFLETGADSLQEKRSVKHVMTLLDKHEILVVKEGVDKELQDEIIAARNLIEQAILWTDITRHKEQMEKVSAVVPQLHDSLRKARASGSGHQEKSKGATAADLVLQMEVHSSLPEKTRVLLGSFLLHVADISNPGRDWATCERWAGLVMNEFFSQGDLEKKLGLPVSMNCDREKVLVPFAQIGFGKFVIRDLYALLSQALHFGGNYLLDNFEVNQRKWREIEEEFKSSGKPYSIKFEPPTIEGGWLGESRDRE
jgi:hypothetical protein